MEIDQQTQQYFDNIDKEIKRAYSLAGKARAQHKDPEPKIDTPIAEDLAARVEGLISTMFPELTNSGLKEGIRELEKQYGKNDERVALKIAEETAVGKYIKFSSKEQALEFGVRVGVAYLTLGVVTAPLEGIASIKIIDDYVSIYYTGPIRSAGGTAEAMSVLLTDYVRKKLGIGEFKANKIECDRYVTEINDYHRLINLQYLPSEEETRTIIENVPICLNGEPTEKQEVSTYKDLSRIETNRIRGGMCLVVAEGLASKANKMLAKIRKFGKEFEIENWKWLNDLIKIQKEEHKDTLNTNDVADYTPSAKYVSRILAGRPVLAHPGRAGGFRLRYGRSRTAGLAATSIHPVAMYLNEFTAIGTQLATEFPGKATVCAPCDTIEPPTVKLNDGSVVELKNKSDLKKHKSEIKEILSLGDMLIPFGEFVSNGHKLLPSAYTEEWWALEVKKALKNKSFKDILKYIEKPHPAPSSELAFKISKNLGVPLHPRYNYFWHDISKDDLKALVEWFSKVKVSDDLILNSDWQKQILETLCVPHEVNKNQIIIKNKEVPIYDILGKPTSSNKDKLLKTIDSSENIMQAVSKLSGVKIKEKGLTRVGMKMGRPEKAERRLMKGRPQILFPCGDEGGRMRNIMAAYEKGKVTADFPVFICPKCKKETYISYCFDCKLRANRAHACINCKKITDLKTCHGMPTVTYKNKIVDIKNLLDTAMERVGIKKTPKLFKGVRGVSSRDKTMEALEKGLLRTKYDLYVNKDGTTRYDATNVPLTHFKPKEIITSIEKLKQLGYTHDMNGKELENKEQILDMKPQDIIISDNEDFSGVGYLTNVAKFVDELLVKFYNLEPFYNTRTREDLLGQLVIGLAPHTSAGIIGRIIGFTSAKVCFAHPFWHAGKRRDADGDEDSIMLLMDALLNFSRQFLPSTRGASTMDAPLVLTTHLDPEEVDNQAWDVDIQENYPLEFYRDTFSYKYPWELTKNIKLVKDVLNTPNVFHISFTNDSSDITDAPIKSKYVTLAAMNDKVEAQLKLAEKIRAVDENKVAEALLEKHFLRDIKGNLRTFSRQQVRCSSCNKKYRRVPLSNKCNKCAGNLILTVSEGTIRKYIEPSKRIMEEYKVSTYLRQQFSILEKNVDSMFGKKDRQLSLGKF